MRGHAGALAVVAGAAAAVVATPARAERFRPSVVATTGGDGTAANVVLVGRSGQLYHPAGDARWERRAVGGVAVDVEGAWTTARGNVFVGGRGSLFARDGDTWQIHPLPNRGPVAAAGAGSAAAVAIGRHVYTLRGERWQRLASSRKGRVVAVWAANAGRVYAATAKGALLRSRGGGFVELSHPLADDDRVAVFAGAAGKRLYAVSAAGTVLRVGASAATELSVPDEVGDFTAEAGAADAAGTAWVAGRGADGAVLLRIDRADVEISASLDWVDAGDRITVVYPGSSGELLVATAGGTVRIRAADGSWRAGEVRGEPPASALRRFPKRAPARTR